MPSDADVRLMRELSNNAVALARRQLEVFLGGLDLRDVQAAQAAIVEFICGARGSVWVCGGWCCC